MIYSLNEIDAHCKKAARGGGFEWGYAEDIGKTMRWLATYDLPGTAVFAAYLEEFDKNRNKFCQPTLPTRSTIEPNGTGNLCPILTGTWLCDAGAIEKNAQLHFQHLSFPLLLMPLLSQIAAVIEQTLTFEYQTTRLQYSNGVLKYNDEISLSCTMTENAKLTMDESSIEGKPAAVVGQDIVKSDWDSLGQYAFKTYVPATEASRQGAGPSE